MKESVILVGCVIVLIIASVAFTVQKGRDCHRQGGVLVRDAWNLPACVAAPRKP